MPAIAAIPLGGVGYYTACRMKTARAKDIGNWVLGRFFEEVAFGGGWGSAELRLEVGSRLNCDSLTWSQAITLRLVPLSLENG